MNDNLFGSTVFALIVAVAIGAATAIVETEIDLARGTVQAAAPPAAQAAAPLMVELPPVRVVGHRKHFEEADADVDLALAPTPTAPMHR